MRVSRLTWLAENMGKAPTRTQVRSTWPASDCGLDHSVLWHRSSRWQAKLSKPPRITLVSQPLPERGVWLRKDTQQHAHTDLMQVPTASHFCTGERQLLVLLPEGNYLVHGQRGATHAALPWGRMQICVDMRLSRSCVSCSDAHA
jgi:hypothetical protein